jgi:hypothetical protein
MAMRVLLLKTSIHRRVLRIPELSDGQTFVTGLCPPPTLKRGDEAG